MREHVSGNHDSDYPHERNDHIGAVEHGGGLLPYHHGEGLYARRPVGRDVVGIVGVQHGNRNDAQGHGKHEGIPAPAAGNRISQSKYGKHAENNEDVQVSQGMIFQEGIQCCKYNGYDAYNQYPYAAYHRDNKAVDNTKDKEHYAEYQILLGLEFAEYQVGHGVGVLVVHSAPIVEPVAEQVARRVQQHYAQKREHKHYPGLGADRQGADTEQICK